jgi:hypothetical protein
MSDILFKGQKWVCIKHFAVEEVEYGDHIGDYKEGDIISIDRFATRESYNFYNDKHESYDSFMDRSYYIHITPYIRNIKLKELLNRFIPLADWRDKQIDKILVDD